MAVPKVQRRNNTPALNAKIWRQKLKTSLGFPLLAVVIALVLSGIMIMFTSSGSIIDRFSSVLNAYQYLYLGSFGSLQSTCYTLVKSTALIFTGISVALAYRAGLFNIGAAGQLTVGAVTAAAIALKAPNLPGWILIPLMIICSALAGAVWGGIVGVLKAWRGAHEVVTTIMLNWIAFYGATAMVEGPLKASNLAQQTLPIPAQAQLPFISALYNQTLGTFLPPIPNPLAYTVDVSFIFAIIALIVYWFMTSRMTYGYELRVVGQNPKAARYAGISVKRHIVLTMALAGAFAALAGTFGIMGQPPYQLIGISFSGNTTGFDAIGVALLGRTTAPGVLLSALLFGGLQQAGPYMQLLAHIPADIVYIVQAIVLFSISIEFLPTLQRTWSRWSRKVPLTPNVIGETVVTSPARQENGDNEKVAVAEGESNTNSTATSIGQEE